MHMQNMMTVTPRAVVRRGHCGAIVPRHPVVHAGRLPRNLLIERTPRIADQLENLTLETEWPGSAETSRIEHFKQRCNF